MSKTSYANGTVTYSFEDMAEIEMELKALAEQIVESPANNALLENLQSVANAVGVDMDIETTEDGTISPA